ncbi:hypothetical protein SAMN05216570_2490 [Dyella sp. OK004]|uniref:hypothetical protein n=1 Tax=Dyella sp. OK004 TaxID=1855292 RepID=UPI0008F15522|nr:hypothetical protein [Dyella sp. OK004]SFS08975.1 hypothetical protein SAMN05216570_2490 [Dyella sp. OK004]
MRRWGLVLLFLLIGWGALHWWRHRPVVQAPGVLAPDAPLQVDIDHGARLQQGDVTLTTRARYELTARVLSREDYGHDAGASLAPVDLALGWGRMSDSAVLASISISQSNRFYYWHVRVFPIPQRDIETSSANTHVIPADEQVRRSLEQIRPGQLVHMEGFLVDASRPDGWQWRTSMTREDTGSGACELMYVESISTVAP